MPNFPKVSSDSKYATLDDLLAAHRSQGVDSEGHFTLNPERARQLLEQFQLPEAAQYALHFVSFLIGAGADSISVTLGRTNISFEAPGADLGRDLLESPFSVLLQSQAKAYQAELALGLNALLGCSDSKVVLRSGGWRAEYSPAEIKVAEQAKVESGVSLVCRRGTIKGQREMELISAVFARAPIPINLDGRPLTSPAEESHEGLEILLSNSSFPIHCKTAADNRLHKPTKAPLSALIHIGRSRPAFRLICLGREYVKEPAWEFFVPGWYLDVTVASDRFKKDLSQQSILENQQYHNIVEVVRVQVEQAMELLLGHLPPLRGTEDLMDDLVEHLFREGKSAVAFNYQKKLSEQLALAENDLRKGRALYRLALIETAMGAKGLEKRHLGSSILSACRTESWVEPRWSLLKADMAFADSPEVEERAQQLVARLDTPALVREQLLRWLVGRRSLSGQARAEYRLELARCAYSTGRFREALAEVDRSDEEASRFELPEHTLGSVELRGRIAARQSRLPEAIELFARHLSLLRQQYGQYDQRLGLTLRRLAALLEYAGKKREAKEYKTWSKRLQQSS